MNQENEETSSLEELSKRLPIEWQKRLSELQIILNIFIHSKVKVLSRTSEYHQPDLSDNDAAKLMVFRQRKLLQGFTDGQILSLKKVKVVQAGIGRHSVTVRAGVHSYIDYLAWFERVVDGFENPNCMVVSGMCFTLDGKIVFSRRAEEAAPGVGKQGVIGGGLDYKLELSVYPENLPYWDLIGPEEIMLQEVIEELGIDKLPESDERRMKVRSGIHWQHLLIDQYQRPVSICAVQLPFTSEELVKLHQASGDALAENDKLILVDDNLEALIRYAYEHGPSEFHSPADDILLLHMNRHLDLRSLKGISTKRDHPLVEYHHVD